VDSDSRPNPARKRTTNRWQQGYDEKSNNILNEIIRKIICTLAKNKVGI